MHDKDRLVAVISDLTNQVARLAWAVESQQVIHANEDGTPVYEKDPCSKCGSQLVLDDMPTCSACLEPKPEKSDA